MNRDEAAPTATDTPATTNTENTGNTSGGINVSAGVTITPQVREFAVTGSSFAFAPNTMRVNKGDTVRITFTNSGGNHDWVIDEFNARTAVLAAGKSQTIEFVANKTGSFEYYCSVGTHRQMGMKGTLTVE